MQFYEENEDGQFVQEMAPQESYHLSLGALDIQGLANRANHSLCSSCSPQVFRLVSHSPTSS